MELIEAMIEHSKSVEPDYIFEISLFSDTVGGGVIKDKIITTTFGNLANADAQELYSDIKKSDFPGLAPTTQVKAVIEAGKN